MHESIIQLSCFKEACRRLRVSFEELDKNGNLVKAQIGGGLFFANYSTPFNIGSTEQICKDKEFTYLLLKDVSVMPETCGYFDPDYRREGYERYKKFRNVSEIALDIDKKFGEPVIVKRNSGMRGENVFLCADVKGIENALVRIFDKKSSDYDYIALAEKYIKPGREFRVVVFKEKPVLVYEKKNGGAKFVGNISPLHYEGARAVMIIDENLVSKLGKFIKPIFKRLPVVFGGFDIIEDEAGKLWLLEINSRPGFAIFVRDNGKEPLIKMYERVLKSL